MPAQQPGDGLEIELRVGLAHAVSAIEVMHRAFAEYSTKGQMSGAMLETAETLVREMEAGERVALAWRGGAPVAVAKHHPTPAGHLYFGRLGVVPEARARGIAAALVRTLRTSAYEQGLTGLACTVRADEEGNIARYERLGMVVVSRGSRASRTGAMLPVVDMVDAVS